MNLLSAQLVGMFDIYAEPSFDELENLAFISQCSDDFVYLLGMCFCKNDLEQIKAFARSRLWFTYRKEFPAIGGSNFNSDVGWGCMLRCGQMLLANALSVLHLGRNWQWQLNSKDVVYRRLLSMFEDQRSAPFSIHQIAQMGVSEGKPLGEWFGPNTIAQVLKKLTIYDEWSNLAVHIAMDNILISDDVRKMAELNKPEESGSTTEAELSTTDGKWRRPLLIIVPLRLGLTVINECYATAIKEFFKLPQCAGIVGGRPNHAVYFFGQAGDKLLYLDPHVSQKRVDVSYGEERLRRRRQAVVNNEETMMMDFGSRPISNSPHFSPMAPSPLNVNISEPTVTDLDSAPTSSLAGDRVDRNQIDSNVGPIEKASGEEIESASISASSIDDTITDSIQLIDSLNPATSSVTDALSSSSPQEANTPEPMNEFSSFSSSNPSEPNVESDCSSAMKRVELPKVKCLNSFTGRRRTKVQKIISPLSHSSGLSSGTEAIESDQLQGYELGNSSFRTFSLDGTNDDTEKIDLPDVLSSKVNCIVTTGVIIGISASSSSSTEMLPPLMVTSATTSMGGVLLDRIQTEAPVTNFEFVESESTEFSNTTTEDERKDEASGESEKLKEGDDLFSASKRKVVRQKRKMKRKVSNDTFTYDDHVVPSDDEFNEFEDVKPRDQHAGALLKVDDHFQCVQCDDVSKEIETKLKCLKSEHSKKESEEMKDEEAPTSDAKSPEPDQEEEDDFDDTTYHCSFILNMDFKTLDPSLALAFICLCAEDYNDLKERLHKSVLPASKPPLFEILENRPQGWPEFVPYSVHDESLKMKEYDDFGDPQFDSDDQFELLV